MVKGKPDPNWKEKVLNWEASTKSMSAWCQENKIPITTLIGWKKRVKNLEVKSGFVELQDHLHSDPGITLEYDGIKIYIRTKFDQTVLKQCLDCIRSVSC